MAFISLKMNITGSISLPLMIILLLLQIKLYICTTCYASDNFNEKRCFNDIIKFDDKAYRAGHILTNKNNVTIIMFSDDSPGDSRLFYALKENGRGFYYDNETSIKVLTLDSDQYYTQNENQRKIIGRYESINEFVYLSDDTNREKQYLFSVSSYYSLTELHDIENGIYQQWVTTDFFNLERKRYIFSYRFSLFEWKKTNVYFCVYVQYKGTNNKGEDYSVSYTISRFSLDRDTSNGAISIKNVQTPKEEEINFDNRIVSSFVVEKYDIIGVFFVWVGSLKFTIRFYDYNLNYKNDIEITTTTMSNPQPGYGAFLKGFHCQYEYVALMYYTNGDDGYSLMLHFIKIKLKNNKYELETRLSQNIRDQNFKTYILLNDFYKINADRFIFASTTNYNKLYIYLIQQINWYKYAKVKKYDYYLPSDSNNIKFSKEFSFGLYKGFLIFTGTISSSSGALSSYLIFFGYANGTDFTADITEYMADIEGYSQKDFATFLLNNASVDNNIFSYELVRQVKLISIPPEILIYKKNSFNTPIPDGSLIDEGNYLLYQNLGLNKTSKLYILDYQFLVKEPTHDTFFKSASEYGNKESEDFYNTFENSRQTLYGRVNRLKMKLCHNYCGKCLEYGISENSQKC